MTVVAVAVPPQVLSMSITIKPSCYGPPGGVRARCQRNHQVGARTVTDLASPMTRWLRLRASAWLADEATDAVRRAVLTAVGRVDRRTFSISGGTGASAGPSSGRR